MFNLLDYACPGPPDPPLGSRLSTIADYSSGLVDFLEPVTYTCDPGTFLAFDISQTSLNISCGYDALFQEFPMYSACYFPEGKCVNLLC